MICQVDERTSQADIQPTKRAPSLNAFQKVKVIFIYYDEMFDINIEIKDLVGHTSWSQITEDVVEKILSQNLPSGLLINAAP